MGVEEYDSTLYQELVGSLLYLTIIHFNIKSSIEICSKFIHHLQLSHLLAAKIILSYIKGTKEFKILFTKKKKKCYIDILTQIGLVIQMVPNQLPDLYSK